MDIDRRKFVKNSALSIIGLGMTTSVFANGIFKNTNYNSSNIIVEKLREAAAFRKAQNFASASTLYNEVIALDVSEVRAYDGLRKILLQEKYKELDVISLYLNGLAQNPTSPIFKERVAKEYIRLTLGNKKFESDLNLNENLLLKAKIMMEECQTVLPNHVQINSQLEKINRKIGYSADTTDARSNIQLKVEKRLNRTGYKDRFLDVPEAQVKQKLDELLAKTKNDYRDKHVREAYRAYIFRLKNGGKIQEAAQYSKVLYQYDNKYSHSLKISRNICRKEKKYELLIEVERENESQKQSFWSKIALFDAIFLRYRLEGIGSVSEMQNILTASSFKKHSFYQNFEYKIRQIKLALIQNNTTQAMTLMNSFADTLIGTSSAHFIDKFNIICVRYYNKISDKQKALQVISIALKEENNTTDLFLKKLIDVNKRKETDKDIHNERLNIFRSKIINQ